MSDSPDQRSGFNELTPDRDFREVGRRRSERRASWAGELSQLTGGAAQEIRAYLASFRRVNLTELALVTRQLSTLMNAGVGISRSLEVLTSQNLTPLMRNAWGDVAQSVSRGSSLSRSMARNPVVFDGLYRGLIKSGESSGGLVANLETLSNLLEKEVMLRQRIKSALAYPSIVLVLCLFATFYLTQNVLPSIINSLFREAGLQLPWITRFVITVTDFVNHPRFWALGLPSAILVGTVFLGYTRTAGGQYRLQQLYLLVPVVSDLQRKILASRFSRTMSCLLRSGIPILYSLQLTDMVLANYVMSPKIQEIIEGVKDGEPMAILVRKVDIFPPLLASFTELGEQSGQLPQLYVRLADLLDEELENAILAATTLLEPVLVGFLGVVVGVIVLAIFLPLYQVLSAI